MSRDSGECTRVEVIVSKTVSQVSLVPAACHCRFSSCTLGGKKKRGGDSKDFVLKVTAYWTCVRLPAIGKNIKYCMLCGVSTQGHTHIPASSHLQLW